MKSFSSMAPRSDSLVAYFGDCMSQDIEGVDHYAIGKLKNGEEFIKLAASSLPNCSVHNYLDSVGRKVQALLLKKGQLPMRAESGVLSSYGRVGGLRHEIAQAYLGRGGRMIGNWKCSDGTCDGQRKYCVYRVCPKCKGPMDYEEISMQVYRRVKVRVKRKGRWLRKTAERSLLGVKIDGIYIDVDGSLWVLDYKFKTSKGVVPKYARKKLPKYSNVRQVESYVALLRQQFKGKPLGAVKGWILCYVPFEQMSMYSRSDEKVVRQAMSKADSDRVLKALERDYKIVTEMNELATSAVDRYLLKGNSGRSNAATAIGDKPCVDLAWFSSKMDCRIGCKFAVDGSCFGPAKEFSVRVQEEANELLSALD